MLRFALAACILLSPISAPAQIAQLESGVAITDPDILAELEEQGFSIGALLVPREATPLKNNELFRGC